jgi:hypothetical protein
MAAATAKVADICLVMGPSSADEVVRFVLKKPHGPSEEQMTVSCWAPQAKVVQTCSYYLLCVLLLMFINLISAQSVSLVVDHVMLTVGTCLCTDKRQRQGKNQWSSNRGHGKKVAAIGRMEWNGIKLLRESIARRSRNDVS